MNIKRKQSFNYIIVLVALLISSINISSQTTIVNYDFNSGTSYSTLSPVLATNISSSATSTEAWQTYTGISTGTGAYTTNSVAGNAIAMANSSGTNTRYFQFQLGGSALPNYSSYKLYIQSQRSSTGASTITLAYSTNGTTFTNFATNQLPGNGAFSENTFDLSTITAINSQSTIYFRILASGASATGTLRIDNFQIRATACVTPTLSVTASSQTICAGNSTTLTSSGATSYTWSPGGVTTASVSVSPTTTTVYTLTGANSSCVSTKTSTITVNAIPTLIITPNTQSICSGSSATLTASGATSYTWNPGGLTTASVSVSPITTTVYSLTGANSTCISTKTANIIVNSSPIISVNSSTPSITLGNFATLTATGATSYTWNPSGTNSASISVSPSVTTTYTVTGSNATCTNTQIISISVNSGIVIVNYDFNTGTSYSTLTPYTATNITSTAASSEPWQAYVGTATGATAFSVNPSAGNAIAMVNSSGTNARYFQFQLGGSALSSYYGYKMYLQAQRSSTGASTITLAYSTDGITYSNFIPSQISGNNSFNECYFDLSTITSINAQSAIYFRLFASGASSSAGTLRIDNLQLKALPCSIPFITIAPSTNTICSGLSTSFSVTGAATYSLNSISTPSLISVSPLVTKVYTITGANTAGCISTKTIAITVNPTPTISINLSNSICKGGSAILTATGANSYSWSSGAITNTLLISPTSTMIYSVIGTSNNCSATNSISVNVSNLIANAGHDEFISSATAISLGGTPSASGGIGTYSYNWLPSGTYNPNSSVSNPTTTVSSSTNFSLTVTETFTYFNGSSNITGTCSSSDQKLVYIITDPYFLVLRKKLDAGYYNTFNKTVYFAFEEEYFDSSVSPQLNYKIVYDDNTAINLSSISLVSTIEKIGDNRFKVNLSSLGLIPNAYYRITITNEKNENWFARFKYL